MKVFISYIGLLWILCCTINSALAAPLVIAHRGASGYLPEHTLAAKAMAYAMGTDYVELDTVLTRDGIAIVFHDLYLDAMTNVAQVFPGRARADGKHYVIDFDYAEIRRLALHERVKLDDGKARFEQRFPSEAGIFRIHSLADELRLIRGLDHSTGTKMGIYVELKFPRWHQRHQHDISATVIDLLHRFDYRNGSDKVYLQSFDAASLRRISADRLTQIPLIQLIGENRWWPDGKTDFDRLRSPAGLREVAGYAVGIGPWYRQIISTENGNMRFSSLVADAHAAGLLVHAYTLRADALPGFAGNLEQLLELLLQRQKVDGLFTDHPDLMRQFVDRKFSQP